MGVSKTAVFASETGLEFRELIDDDYPILLEWLLLPHVREWWDEGEHTIEKVREAYGPEDGVRRYVLLRRVEDVPDPVAIGYFQSYAEGAETVGIDLFIGDPDLVGKGVGTRAVSLFARKIFTETSAGRIILDPHPENLRAIRCYEKAGFRHYETVDDRDGKTAYMMELLRDNLEAGSDE